ncbi:MAG: ferredoxin family protein [Planctomycetota bacterium]
MAAARQTSVLYCHCAHTDVIPPQAKREVFRQLNASGVPFEAVADLCEASARRDPMLRRLAESGDLRVAACYPRAVKWLFHAAGAPLTDGRVKVMNMREQGADEVASGLLADCQCACADAVEKDVCEPRPGAWMPWFPVIDYDLCTNCKQCLSFCLFGVFGVDADGNVEVRNPDKCKTRCPACSRVCPSVAIVFPKYDKRPVNGDVVCEGDVGRDVVKVDLDELVDKGVRASLRARSGQRGGRFSPARAANGALTADLQHLKKMQAELDIPDQVFRGLPVLNEPDCGCSCECQPASAPDRDCACECTDESESDCACDCDCSAESEASSDIACDCVCECAGEDSRADPADELEASRPCCDPGEKRAPASQEEEWDI